MFSKARSTPKDANDTIRAHRVPRRTSRLRKQSKNIAAIDFGTKNCSLSYITENDKLEITRGIPKLPLNGTYLRVPTAILFNPSGEVEAFGHDARTLYANLDDEEREVYVYFEEIKMNLHKDQEVSRELKISAMNGQQFYLVDVIGHILRHLKEELLFNHLQRGGHSFQTNDFDWVITVPAIWKARGKQLMREAGYRAGLCSQQPFIRLLKASDKLPGMPLETAPHKLTLALEPESASLYCHEMLSKGLVAPYCDNPSGSFVPHSYVLVDIGGGTVDISAHRIVDCSTGSATVEEIRPPLGNDWGGTRVNREFVKFLERLVSDLEFSNYVNTQDVEVNIRNKCELNHLINVTFEEQKQIYGRLPKDKRKEVVIRLPVSMLEIYKEEIIEGIETVAPTEVKLVRQNLRISPTKMEDFFNPVVTEILLCMKGVLGSVEGLLDVIYLVGGFGGCPYIYRKIVDEFGIGYRCVVPPNPEYAVVEGAVVFQADPSVIHSRRADATYGKSVIRPFNTKIHDLSHRICSDNTFYCDDLFQVIVEVGDVLHPNYVYTCTSLPSHSHQRNMCIEIFCSPFKASEVWYVSGKGSEAAEKIGELVVEFQDPESDKLREIEFVFDFSHTEIFITAYDKSSGVEFKTVLDFLSSQS